MRVALVGTYTRTVDTEHMIALADMLSGLGVKVEIFSTTPQPACISQFWDSGVAYLRSPKQIEHFSSVLWFCHDQEKLQRCRRHTQRQHHIYLGLNLDTRKTDLYCGFYCFDWDTGLKPYRRSKKCKTRHDGAVLIHCDRRTVEQGMRGIEQLIRPLSQLDDVLQVAVSAASRLHGRDYRLLRSLGCQVLTPSLEHLNCLMRSSELVLLPAAHLDDAGLAACRAISCGALLLGRRSLIEGNYDEEEECVAVKGGSWPHYLGAIKKVLKTGYKPPSGGPSSDRYQTFRRQVKEFVRGLFQ